MVVVDTTVWVDFFAGRPTPQVRRLKSLIEDGEDVALCGVILAEILQGIRADAECARLESVLRNFLFLEMSRETFLSAAHIYRSLRARGVTIRNSVDCMIAACCIENRAQLLHNDRDFVAIASHAKLECVNVA
ncbi:MAG: PIN domain-containing protein [Candidatus Brocadiia bacterium]